jgi:hypothetical protein
VSGQGFKGPSNIGRDMVSIEGRVLLLIYTGSVKAVEWRLLELRSVRVRWVDHKCKVNSDEFDREATLCSW